MRRIWSEEYKFQKWLEIEILACEAQAALGNIPEEALAAIKERARFDVRRILELEAVTRHDVIAFLTCVGEYVGEAARYIHMGLTSSDILDTALAVMMKEAGQQILTRLERLREVLLERAREHRRTLMIGRTHGVHAEPTTFGLKMLLWVSETERNIRRMRRAVEVVSVGKLAGAVGTYATVDPRVEAYVCARLGLRPARVATQVVQRDRHAEYMSTCALVAASLEKFATEIRNLQRTEIREVEEFFAAGQKGSSAMPHKRNPITAERISGLARVVRANALAALENVALWHERDISHSSVERVIIPDSTTLLDYMLARFTDIMERLLVYPENMRRNLERTGGLVFSQRVLLALVAGGMDRDEAYRVVQRHAMSCWRGEGGFFDLLRSDEAVRSRLSEEELGGLFDYGYFLRHVDDIYARFGL
jgi:adenylosuccinate lyase